ncbi:hypothetical protein SELMODRAFT_407147 [Selaginella moellendorffii]|uniref:Uncharacterized protein n=1 Tax=Selaginella moellendorffii TaxID=88036 RepID=D8R424_SELML|nr:hypothetical protein SELMODRAFT_407147 [Selaginella moellendorffii]
MFGGGYRKGNGLPAQEEVGQACIAKQPEEDAGQFWVPSLATVKSWANVEDDDDYFATTTPAITTKASQESSVNHNLNHLEDSMMMLTEEVEEEKSEGAFVIIPCPMLFATYHDLKLLILETLLLSFLFLKN